MPRIPSAYVGGLMVVRIEGHGEFGSELAVASTR
jgi:hypothetical protein